MVSVRLWITTCLAAALIGVCAGATYTAVNGRFDVPVASGALPGPSEHRTRLAPAGERERTDSVAGKAVPGHVDNAATTAQSQADRRGKAKAPAVKPEAKAAKVKAKAAKARPAKAGEQSRES